MREPITITELRSKIYQVFDHVIASGESCEVVRGGQSLLISVKKKKPKKNEINWYEKIKQQGPRKQSVINCDEETLIYGKLDEWSDLKNI